jgi:hypothetical protein
MADAHNDRHTPERYEDTMDPRNPPNSVVNPRTQRAALRVYLLPLVAFFLVAGLGLIYWANRSPVTTDSPAEIGTTGEGQDVVGERGNREDTPGGFDPAARPGSTAEEIEFRGGGAPLNELGSALEDEPRTVIGRRIDVRDVTVAEVRDAGQFWVQDGNAKVAVSAPGSGPAVQAGHRVNLSGVVEGDGQGGVRIRASRVTTSETPR